MKARFIGDDGKVICELELQSLSAKALPPQRPNKARKPSAVRGPMVAFSGVAKLGKDDDAQKVADALAGR